MDTSGQSKLASDENEEGEMERPFDADWQELGANDHLDKFDPQIYLQSFYSSPKEDNAMTIMLFFLPGIIYRLPVGGTLLDLGAGPTIHVPMIFRSRIDSIYTSDYSLANRKELIRWWIDDKEQFDWTAICDWIAMIESIEFKDRQQMMAFTRSKVRAVLTVDVHKPNVVDSEVTFPPQTVVPTQFDIVATIFCLEYASENIDQYSRAVANSLKLLKPGGYLLQGGVLHESHYSFDGRKYRCCYLTKDRLLQCLRDNQMDIEGEGFKLICQDDIFVLISRKNH